MRIVARYLKQPLFTDHRLGLFQPISNDQRRRYDCLLEMVFLIGWEMSLFYIYKNTLA